MDSSSIVEREAVRAILLTPRHDVLLLRVSLPNETPFWITPGGGIEPGEAVEACFVQEGAPSGEIEVETLVD